MGLLYDAGVPIPFYLLRGETKGWIQVKAYTSLHDALRALEERSGDYYPWVVVNDVWLLWALNAPTDAPLVIQSQEGPRWWWPRDPAERRAAVIAAATLYCKARFWPLPAVSPCGYRILVPPDLELESLIPNNSSVEVSHEI